MTGNKDKDRRLFWIGYSDDESLFIAYVEETSGGPLMRAEVSGSLADLLQKCEQNEFTETFVGAYGRDIIERIHWWLNVERPALEYLGDLWKGSGNPSTQGPIGFPTPNRDG